MYRSASHFIPIIWQPIIYTTVTGLCLQFTNTVLCTSYRLDYRLDYRVYRKPFAVVRLPVFPVRFAVRYKNTRFLLFVAVYRILHTVILKAMYVLVKKKKYSLKYLRRSRSTAAS